MKKIWEWIKSNPNRTMFLIPIILVAGISISHVVSWYNIANPLSWAIYLSIAIEVGAMTALVAATNKIKGGVWFMFGLVTLIQMIGNIFFSYKEIDPNGDLFKSWVELTGPVWEMIGSDPSDIPAMKRWLSFLEGGLLPVISLTSLHFFVKYEDKKEDTPQVEDDTNVTHKEDTDQVPTNYRPSTDQVIDETNVEKLTNSQKEEVKIWNKVRELKDEGKLSPDPTPEEIEEEPTALANSQYRNEEFLNDDIVESYLFPSEEEPVKEETKEDEVRRLVYTKPV